MTVHIIKNGVMYTIAKVAEPWRSLFPKITETGTNIEVDVRGQSFKIEIPKKRSTIAASRNLEFR